MRRVLVSTFGCKLNQYDSQVISESFASKGFELSSDMLTADVCVVNTCSVTARSDYEARQLVRRILRINPRVLMLVTGCYAQRAPQEIAHIGGVGLVAGNAEKSSLPELVESLCDGGETRVSARASTDGEVRVNGEARIEVSSPGGVEECRAVPDWMSHVPTFQRRSRALVKIQDGCDGLCSYCVVPSVRGRSKSEPIERILEQVKYLSASGFREVVLTGARTGSYGNDLGDGYSLETLLGALVRGEDGLRFRLSSLEPGEVSASLVEYMAQEEKVCRHFHVPVQSCDSEILRAMHRPYSPTEYVEKIQMIHSRFCDACIGSDVMVGFPGETESAFARTYGTIEKLPLSYLHVFPFSRRPGTRASDMKQEPTRSVKRARAFALRALGMRKKSAFAESQVGTFAEAVLEEEVEPGLFKGTTGNYLKVLVRANGKRVKDAIPVKIASRTNDTLLARAC
jgi:threonylcarbamoyladenosine tRNA methylthiotransferase MtaB